MNLSKITKEKKAVLSSSGKALVVTMLIRLVFGAYLAAQDYYAYHDVGSALTVLGIYVLLGIFTVLFVSGKRFGLAGILWLSVILIIFHTVFIIVSMGQVDAGLHDPLQNWWAALLRYPFFLLTLMFCIKVYREKRELLRSPK